jgi:hypothetical protein
VPRAVESDLFKALSRNSEYADMFIAALTGSIPLRQFQSPAVIVRLIGMRGLFSLLSRGGREVNTGSTPVVTG